MVILAAAAAAAVAHHLLVFFASSVLLISRIEQSAGVHPSLLITYRIVMSCGDGSIDASVG